jgi:hypothetical protein
VNRPGRGVVLDQLKPRRGVHVVVVAVGVGATVADFLLLFFNTDLSGLRKDLT